MSQHRACERMRLDNVPRARMAEAYEPSVASGEVYIFLETGAELQLSLSCT